MKRFAILPALLVLSVSTSGCGLVRETPPARPAAATIDTVGLLATFQDYGDKIVYVLADGSQVERATAETRLAYELPGDNMLFVSGNDAEGAFVARIGAPDDTPEGCDHVVRYGLREWGDAIESQGLLWSKAQGFLSSVPIPPVGTEYAERTFLCLDETAHVTQVGQLNPSGAPPAAPASATVP